MDNRKHLIIAYSKAMIYNESFQDRLYEILDVIEREEDIFEYLHTVILEDIRWMSPAEIKELKKEVNEFLEKK